MIDYHVHTHHSFDGFHSMEELVTKGISLGLSEICFTDHKDYDYDGKGSEFTFSYKDYFFELEQMQNKFEDKISIKSGVEFGLQPHNIKQYEDDIALFPFDYIIGSIHSAKKSDIFIGDFFETRNQKQAYDDYFDDMLQVIRKNATFSVLGHMDVIKRYGDFPSPLSLNEYIEYPRTIFKEIIQQDKGIEVNTSGFRYNLNATHPSIDLLKLFHQLGGEIIVPGSDTHQINDLGFHLIETLKLLHHIGYRYIASFDKMKPRFHKIESFL
ncbi:histidinol-phosphatase HisJ family protein [Tindallia californiensis]|uniref:Histidinol-phosphatase n=1 Tax=Tindallia californiensis TaxID=159292 RepID=A0A1H3IE60_9FIRM|nr:histidinol-phosphatase HisJ family protein [Tindallia californiensis]SDY25996.1 histidinol-phosphatase (PHP family) [Tindallia californiensis]